MELSQLTEEIKCANIKELIANLEKPPVNVSTPDGSRVVHGSQHNFDEDLKDVYFWRGQSFLYRGMSNSEWTLLPSLFRDLNGEVFEKRIAQLVGFNRYKGNFGLPSFNSFNGNFSANAYKARIALIMEFYFLDAFYRNANMNGLRVPAIRAFDEKFSSSGYNIWGGEGEIIRKFLGGRDEYGESNDCPYIEYESLAALAQHYSVSTRLLDWSYDMMVALYFAILGAAKAIMDGKKDIDNNCCAVWVMDAENLESFSANKLRIVTPPYFDNPNLAAQKGVLTYWNVNNLEEHLAPLDEQISAYYSSRMDCKHLLSHKRFYKYTLPYSEVKHALQYLIIKGYTAARLFPGYRGVVKSFDEHRMFQLLCEPDLVEKHIREYFDESSYAESAMHIDLTDGEWRTISAEK